MNSSEIRKQFIDFFKSKGHEYVQPSYIVNKNDPTLMFTNAGMNQFKNIFLGKEGITKKRLVNSQPCLRISGKHNDIEEVGIDMYHHTLFEMLGNWSMNDYFKKNAIEYSWELLTEIYKLKKQDLYITIFDGDKEENLEKDMETYNIWSNIVDKDHIVFCSKKDNFWEMGEIGPCGPCTEIHIDLRSDEEKIKIPGRQLINTGHKEVIEIWNIVFIQYERNENNLLQALNKKFVDTGMGLERLVMVLQGKKSTYDTDIFKTYMDKINDICGYEYTAKDTTVDISFRVISDHIRTIAMSIIEGLVPSNIKEGYVIRMILRRAQRYGYSFLNLKEPFLYKLVEIVFEQFKDIIVNYKHANTIDVVKDIVKKEEENFLKVLKEGHKKLMKIIDSNISKCNKIISGEEIFKLKDTFGFPAEMSELILKEKNMTFNKEEYNSYLLKQKNQIKTKN